MRAARDRGLLQGENLSEVQALAVDFLRFLDGQEHTREREEMLTTLVKSALVATDRYDETKVFPDYFPAQQEVPSDAEVDFGDVRWDSEVQWTAPAEDELEILTRMMQDNMVHVSGETLAPPEESQAAPALPDGDPEPEQIESNREWV